jgi:hypothetical protein
VLVAEILWCPIARGAHGRADDQPEPHAGQPHGGRSHHGRVAADGRMRAGRGELLAAGGLFRRSGGGADHTLQGVHADRRGGVAGEHTQMAGRAAGDRHCGHGSRAVRLSALPKGQPEGHAAPRRAHNLRRGKGRRGADRAHRHLPAGIQAFADDAGAGRHAVARFRPGKAGRGRRDPRWLCQVLRN